MLLSSEFCSGLVSIWSPALQIIFNLDIKMDNITSQELHELSIEDIEDDVDTDAEPYQHIKERKVVIQPYDYAVRTLVDMIIEGDLTLEPDYQRKYQWDNIKASREGANKRGNSSRLTQSFHFFSLSRSFLP
ncbi:hypothetical protein L1871_02325 [Aeromonas caviae]|uniref:hypothetical protein n=1 Tax=Aeromonas caviae TaxID=648 RepID=UPI001F2D512B|nr:hypothetical protein [Aeromonas caviae]UJQ37393.1 hypothetical protein L1871_02325 [Aeromonas caviae]